MSGQLSGQRQTEAQQGLFSHKRLFTQTFHTQLLHSEITTPIIFQWELFYDKGLFTPNLLHLNTPTDITTQ